MKASAYTLLAFVKQPEAKKRIKAGRYTLLKFCNELLITE